MSLTNLELAAEFLTNISTDSINKHLSTKITIRSLYIEPNNTIRYIDLPINVENVFSTYDIRINDMAEIMADVYKCQHYKTKILGTKNYCSYSAFYQASNAESGLPENKLINPLINNFPFKSDDKCFGTCYIIKINYMGKPIDCDINEFINCYNSCIQFKNTLKKKNDIEYKLHENKCIIV